MKIRPLNELSDFVVELMPAMLASTPETLSVHAEDLAVRCRAQRSDFDSGMLPVASLDAKMLEAAIVHSGFTVPATLTDLVNRLSGDELPMLAYEEIVLANPRADLRVFTCGEIGETEAAFYRGHRHIEEQLESAIHDVRRAIDLLHTGHSPERAAEALGRTRLYLKEIPVMMATLKNMPKGHFETFRRYLGSHPTRELKGPSGAFSAGIPTLEVLFRGDQLSAEYLGYLTSNKQYLPREGRVQLDRALESAAIGLTLASLWHKSGESPELRGCVDVLGGFFNGFRRAHYKAVEQQLPDAVADKIAGTGGEATPGQFLRDRMKTTTYRR